MALSHPGWEELSPRGGLGDSGVRWVRSALVRLSTRAAGGRGNLRGRSDPRKTEIPWSPAVRVQVAARIQVRCATMAVRMSWAAVL